MGLLLVTAGAIAAIGSWVGGLITYGHGVVALSDLPGLFVLLALTVVPAALLWVPVVRGRSSVAGWAPGTIACCAILTALFGIELAGAYSRYGPVLFFAGLAQLLAALDAVRHTTVRWRASVAVAAAPFVAYALFMGQFVVVGKSLPPTRWEIPDGYRGYVTTAYGVSTCAPLPKDLFVSVVIVDDQGHACTSEALPNGYVELWTEYVFVRGTTRIPMPVVRSGEIVAVPSAWSFSDSYDGSCPRARKFFVGTSADALTAPKLFDGRLSLGCDLKPLTR
jgi:hypothetical protein